MTALLAVVGSSRWYQAIAHTSIVLLDGVAGRFQRYKVARLPFKRIRAAKVRQSLESLNDSDFVRINDPQELHLQ